MNSVFFTGPSGRKKSSRWEHIVACGHEEPLPANGTLPSPSPDVEIRKQGGDIKPGTYATPAGQSMIARYAAQTNSGTLLCNTSFADDAFGVRIESIGKEDIRGTFSGKLRSMEGKAIQISGGSFNLRYDKSSIPNIENTAL